MPVPTLDDLQAQIQQLQRQQALQTDAIRRILEGRWTGDLPSAAADYAALVGGAAPADFQPLSFDPADQ